MPGLDPVRRRFIPAWAGNTRRAARRPLPASVHPRVGGEHLLGGGCGVPAAGSSPRGRGTRSEGSIATVCDRFIPAWAGNTSKVGPIPVSTTVHPRVGGEHGNRRIRGVGCGGSSPRGRGTQAGQRPGRPPERFIPAWAGNTAQGLPSRCRSPVHPRVGGEHENDLRTLRTRAGSSPRGRGTPGRGPIGCAAERFIPAWAGNTRTTSPTTNDPPVHPRVGGEHGADPLHLEQVAGSSPRGRGTRSRATGR